jgi:hypothetical protein
VQRLHPKLRDIIDARRAAIAIFYGRALGYGGHRINFGVQQLKFDAEMNGQIEPVCGKSGSLIKILWHDGIGMSLMSPPARRRCDRPMS